MTDQEPVSRPDLMLTAIAGGYLRNPVRRKGVTCADCATPVVLLIDDTGATGGHAHSAALALRNVGARAVSLLVVARWLKEEYGGNRSFIADLARRDFNPQTCPWTGNECP
jgi:hypothetical protein